jgi:hypothetical protein
MTNVNLDFDRYYINQGDANYSSITFKNKTTVGAYGCGVCCAAMIICKKLGLTSVADKRSILQKVIADATNNNGLLTYSPVSYNNTTFTFNTGVADMAQQLLYSKPTICQLNGHYVLVKGYNTSQSGYSAYLIKDPGAMANSNLQQPMNTYGSTIIKKISLD